MWILEALVLTLCVLGIYSVRAWLMLLHEERDSKTCPRCGSVLAPDPSPTGAGTLPSCPHCPIEGCPFKMTARGWINSGALRPPE